MIIFYLRLSPCHKKLIYLTESHIIVEDLEEKTIINEIEHGIIFSNIRQKMMVSCNLRAILVKFIRNKLLRYQVNSHGLSVPELVQDSASYNKTSEVKPEINSKMFQEEIPTDFITKDFRFTKF